jgi:hypothetical protein
MHFFSKYLLKIFSVLYSGILVLLNILLETSTDKMSLFIEIVCFYVVIAIRMFE